MVGRTFTIHVYNVGDVDRDTPWHAFIVDASDPQRVSAWRRLVTGATIQALTDEIGSELFTML